MRIGKTAHALMNNVKLHDERKRLRLRKSPAGNQSPLHDAGVHLHRRPERVALGGADRQKHHPPGNYARHARLRHLCRSHGRRLRRRFLG